MILKHATCCTYITTFVISYKALDATKSHCPSILLLFQRQWHKYLRQRRKSRNYLTRCPPSKEKPHEDVNIEIKICVFANVQTTHLVSGMLPHNSIASTYSDVPLYVRGTSRICLSPVLMHFICTVSSCLPIKICRKYKNYDYNCSGVESIFVVWPSGVVLSVFLIGE